MKLLFAHGWGFDYSVWNNVTQYLPQSVESVYLDFGYTNNKVGHNIKDQNDLICIGHSLGCLWLLKNIPSPTAFIAINGFDCFYKHVPKQQLQRMTQNLNRNLQAQMRGFYKACQADFKENASWNITALKKGLEWLSLWNFETERQTLSCPVKAICSVDDAIVPPKMSTKIWNKNDVIWSQEGGHILPLTRPQWCANQIVKVINEIQL